MRGCADRGDRVNCCAIPLLFHPVWFTAGENIVCSKYDDGYDIEYLEGLENDESMLKNNDTEKNCL